MIKINQINDHHCKTVKAVIQKTKKKKTKLKSYYIFNIYQ